MTQSKKDIESASSISKIFVWLSIIIIAIVLIIFYFWKDASDRHRFKVNNNEVEAIYQGSIKPMNPIPSEVLDARYHPILIGNGFWQSIACIDQTCPQISKKWAIQLNVGEEQLYMISLAKKYDYEITLGDETPCDDDLRICDIFAKKTGFSLDLSISKEGLESLPAPEGSKQWRYLNMTIRLMPRELGL